MEDCVQQIVEVLQAEGIVPRSAVEKVCDLTVPEEKLEEAVAEADPEAVVERGSLTGSPATAGLASRPRRREEVAARETGATLRMT